MQGPGADQTDPVTRVQTQPTKHKLRGAQLWGGQSPAKTFKYDFGWPCLECDDFLQLCQVDSDFPHFISVIKRTKYRIECLLSNVSNAIRRSCVLILQCFTKFQMFRSAYRTGRMHDRQFGHRKNKTKWGHQQFVHLINNSFILAFRCSAWRNVIIGDLTLGISYLGGCQANIIVIIFRTAMCRAWATGWWLSV